ncbi:MAG TPA: T9SS type A sorting domain-containing protein [Ignavibacteriaceae bacterium]|nr:T9SS type A sorting domain-containing protein [Ignavibacteriaceae bacterium]
MKKITTIIFLIITTFYLLQPELSAHRISDKKDHKALPHGKVLVDPGQSLININNATCWVGGDGYHDWVVGGSWNGSFPINYFAGTIFSEGIVWGGKVIDNEYPSIRAGGNTYGTGCASLQRLFRVRTNFRTTNLAMDAATFFNIDPGEVTQQQIGEIYAQYQKDWDEWPADNGAPYEDVNQDGSYDPVIDIPGVPSASQTMHVRYDDSNSPYLYGSLPIGLEVTETYWTFSDNPESNNTIFKKVDIVYTGGNQPYAGSHIDSMFISQWSDPDVGNSTDDFAGCDTLLNLGYSYNSSAEDIVYGGLGLEPPATGYVLLQGVSEYSGFGSDSAIYNFNWRHGYKYSNPHPMSSFAYIAAGGIWLDPDFSYIGTLELYNMMRGFQGDPSYPGGQQFPESVADYTGSGCFLLTGDPVSAAGKIDGVLDGPGDRRILLTNGPFHMDLGDTVEIVIALTSAIGSDRLSSITDLRANASAANDAFQNYAAHNATAIDEGVSKKFDFRLSQNFPNPFNPSTGIQYSISQPGRVTLKVYDMLGREVAGLVDEQQAAGDHTVNFDGTNLSSGIYFYQLKIPGNFSQTKKMLLLK